MAGLFANRPSRTVLGSMLRRSTSTAAVLDRLLEAASHQDSDPKAFLQVLEGAAVDLQVVKADRSYRQDFTGNYRLIFPDEGRRYNTDIMHACQVGRQDIWVNGTFHESDASMKRFAEDVRRCFNELQKLLRAWSQSSMLSRTPQVKPLLTRLDIAWASFEQHYVMWLIQIESQAFAPLMAAISLEKELFTQECQVNKFRLDELTRARQLAQSPKRLREPSEGTLCRRSREVSGVSSPCSSRHPSNADSPCSRQKFFPEERVQFGVDAESESRSTNIRTKSNLLQHTAYSASRRTSSACRKALERLVDQVAELNSLANVQGRGRKDLTVDVLQAAADVFKRFPEDDRKQSGLIDDQLASASASASMRCDPGAPDFGPVVQARNAGGAANPYPASAGLPHSGSHGEEPDSAALGWKRLLPDSEGLMIFCLAGGCCCFAFQHIPKYHHPHFQHCCSKASGSLYMPP
eukprot:TRINITY_DN8257_c0_g8_i1.p1 TRINITY_DN8257_c0_g8~~TRINITY_DN8257_c0_g8_i1.p1  ORF type:complete len:464 (-),score=72.44 TRINITY_DN8257_c0_g8_i1:58-1449(-)